MLRQLFVAVGGGCETDTFKQVQASMTVLRSLGSAATLTNRDSSRMVGGMIPVITLQCLSIGTPNTTTFPFVQNGE